MIDLSILVNHLGKIPSVLKVSYRETRSPAYTVDVLQDSPTIRLKISRVMRRYNIAYQVSVRKASRKHVREVQKIAAEGRKTIPKGKQKEIPGFMNDLCAARARPW